MGLLFSFGFAELHDYWILKLFYRSSFLKETEHFVFSRNCGLHRPRQKSFSDLLMVPVSFVGIQLAGMHQDSLRLFWEHLDADREHLQRELSHLLLNPPYASKLSPRCSL
jgi:hypothetical protein